jgi:tRNA-binding protein
MLDIAATSGKSQPVDYTCVRRGSICRRGGVVPEIGWKDFEKVDVRVGRVVAAEPFPEAHKPAIKLSVDFGPEVGVKSTSARLTDHYEPDELIGKQVVAVVNFPPKRIAGFKSEALVLGVPDEEGAVVLLAPDREVPLGGRMF